MRMAHRPCAMNRGCLTFGPLQCSVKVCLPCACNDVADAAPAVCHLLPAGGWKAPKTPLLAVPLNMTAGYSMWQNMDAALKWARTWAKGKPAIGA